MTPDETWRQRTDAAFEAWERLPWTQELTQKEKLKYAWDAALALPAPDRSKGPSCHRCDGMIKEPPISFHPACLADYVAGQALATPMGSEGLKAAFDKWPSQAYGRETISRLAFEAGWRAALAADAQVTGKLTEMCPNCGEMYARGVKCDLCSAAAARIPDEG